MAKTTINNGDTGQVVRTAINNNFTEVYNATTAYQSASAGFVSSRELETSFSAPYNYIGTAPKNTNQSSASWSISRLTVASDGSIIKAIATGAWNNKDSLTYV